MPVKSLLSKLQLKMASLHSSRTQCCCCAIGVVAAMFGVFMLSAGICIVVNVGMEVDTSGLPSNLHNDDGRRIVGIILICVAVATMALSASVGIVYFVVCNRKPDRRSTVATGTRVTGSAEPHHSRTSRNHKGASSGIAHSTHRTAPSDRLPGPERTRSKDSVRTASQQSLRAAASLEPQGPRGSSSHGARPPGSRYKHKRSHKSRGFRPGMMRYQSGLEPHMEEDAEAAKSVVDLKREGVYVTKSDLHPQAWSEDGREDTGEFDPQSGYRPPAITLTRAHSNSGKEAALSSTTYNAPQRSDETGTLDSTFNSTINNTSFTADTTGEFELSQTATTDMSMSRLDDTCLTKDPADDFDASLQTIGDDYVTPIKHSTMTSAPFTKQKTSGLPKSASNTFQSNFNDPPHVPSSERDVTDEILSPPYGEARLLQQTPPSVPSTSTLSSASLASMSSQSSSTNAPDNDSNTHHTSKESRDQTADGESHSKHKHRSGHKKHSQKQGVPTDFTNQTALLEANAVPPQTGSEYAHLPKYNPAFSTEGGDPDPDEVADLTRMRKCMEELMEEPSEV